MHYNDQLRVDKKKMISAADLEKKRANFVDYLELKETRLSNISNLIKPHIYHHQI